MATKRKMWILREKDVLYVEEHHDGNYGAPGKGRCKRAKPTKEQQMLINAQNKAKKARLRLLEYFDNGDIFATWTYEKDKRPLDMKGALKHFQSAMRIVRKEYEKRGREVFWIRNIERGTKGAWHIHLVINQIGETVSILEKAWKHGGVYSSTIKKNDKIYDEDFTKLANYITKDENTRYQKKNGEDGQPRIREANYSTSRNMPLPESKKKELVRWQEEVKPKKGYVIIRCHEGINPLGFKYRRYTMIRIEERRKTSVQSKHLCGVQQKGTKQRPGGILLHC